MENVTIEVNGKEQEIKCFNEMTKHKTTQDICEYTKTEGKLKIIIRGVCLENCFSTPYGDVEFQLTNQVVIDNDGGKYNDDTIITHISSNRLSSNVIKKSFEMIGKMKEVLAENYEKFTVKTYNTCENDVIESKKSLEKWVKKLNEIIDLFNAACLVCLGDMLSSVEKNNNRANELEDLFLSEATCENKQEENKITRIIEFIDNI